MSIPSVRSYLALIVSRLPPKRTLPSFRPIEKHLPQHLNSSFTSNLNPPSDALVCHATRLVLCASSDSLKDDTIPWLQSISSLEVLPEVLPPASSTLPPPFIREIICHYHPNPPPVSPLSSLLSSIFPPPPHLDLLNLLRSSGLKSKKVRSGERKSEATAKADAVCRSATARAISNILSSRSARNPFPRCFAPRIAGNMEASGLESCHQAGAYGPYRTHNGANRVGVLQSFRSPPPSDVPPPQPKPPNLKLSNPSPLLNIPRRLLPLLLRPRPPERQRQGRRQEGQQDTERRLLERVQVRFDEGDSNLSPNLILIALPALASLAPSRSSQGWVRGRANKEGRKQQDQK